MNIYKLQEGLDALDRIKLLMEYDMSKTLTENKEKTLSEQPDEKFDTPYNKELIKKYNKKTPSLESPPPTPPTYEEVIKKRGVPWGFEPNEYPEYLKKVQEINQKYDKQDNYRFQQFQQNPTDVPMGNTIQKQKGFDTVGQKQKELDDLKKEYYHFDFPYGISKESYKLWSDAKKLRLKEKQVSFAEAKKFYQGDIRPIVPGSDYFATVSSNQKEEIYKNKLGNISKKYQTIEDYLNVIFEHDPTALAEVSKSGLQKWWEKWRDVVEFVGWIVLDIASEGIATTAEGRQAYLLAKIIRNGAQVGIPVVVGSVIMIEEGGLTSESIMYFCFAVLPYAHAAFGLNQKPTVELCESILSKMKGINLKNPKELKLFVSKLSQSEKSLFRKVALFDKNIIENGSKWAIENISINASRKIDNINNLIKHYGLKNIKPSMLVKGGKFIGRLAADLTGIELVTKIFSKLGLTWKEEKKQQLINYFNDLLKSKQDPFYKLLLVLNTFTLLSENPNSELSQLLPVLEKITKSDMNKSAGEQADKVLQTLLQTEMTDILWEGSDSDN